MAKNTEVITSYKGFNKDMTCRDFKYEEGKTYKEDKAEVCYTGFHACEYPLDVLCYYEPNRSVYRKVTQSGKLSRLIDDTKVASTEITIGEELSLADLVRGAIAYTTARANPETMNPETSSYENYGMSSTTSDFGASSTTGNSEVSSATGVFGASSATGNRGASSATGKGGTSSVTGYKGASSATGDRGTSSATGDRGASSATGYYGASSATGIGGISSATGIGGISSVTGEYGASSATGNRGASSATSDRGVSSVTGAGSVAVTTGYEAIAEANNPDSIAVAFGAESKAKGVKGAYIVLTERDDDENITSCRMIHIDGKRYKADTFYCIKDGKVVEA